MPAPESTLILQPQITLNDLLAATHDLDTSDFVKRTLPLVPYVPDLEATPHLNLICALHDTPLPAGGSFQEWFAPYSSVGITDPRWRRLLLNLRVQGHAGASILVHPEAWPRQHFSLRRIGDEFDIVPARAFALRRRSTLLRPSARTLGVSIHRQPGGAELGRVPPFGEPNDQDVVDLAEAVAARVEPTVGGPAFLAPDRFSHALSVLASTVAAILSDPSSQRSWRGTRVVRADVYERIFEAMGLAQYFQAARRVLEINHPDRIPTEAPWPPGQARPPQDIGILEYEADYLVLHRRVWELRV